MPNARLDKFLRGGYRPSKHAEFLDLYNQRAQDLATTIKARIDDCLHYIVIEYD